MLQCLDGDHRIAFVLGEIVGLSSPEAAEVLGIEPAAFRKRLSRARTTLVDFLRSNCGVFEESAPCRCHFRVERALTLSRVRREAVDVDRGELVQLRAHLKTLGEVQRVVAYYHDEPELVPKRDFVATVRALLALDTKESP
jgi:hypothetical protein